MKKPIIGLTPTITEGERPLMETRLHYVRAIEAAGGAPVLLPPLGGESLRAAAAVCDGFLFTGGVDVHPALYGQEVLPACGEISAVRDEMELALMQLAIDVYKRQHLVFVSPYETQRTGQRRREPC